MSTDSVPETGSLGLGWGKRHGSWEKLLVLDRFSSCAANALALARDEARLLAHPYVGTEHLLIGLAREERGAAARVLGSLDLSAEQLRESIVFIGGRGEADPPLDDPTWTPR